jgi:diguanylate cyclase (GGDEF)-like protein
MTREQDSLLTELHSLVTAVEVSARTDSQAALNAHLKALGEWTRRLILQVPASLESMERDNAELRQRLRSSKSSFDSMVEAYKAILDAFETFRETIDLVQRIKRLEDLPQTLDTIREMRGLHSLRLILDQDLFAGRVPDGIGRAQTRTIRERLRQFSPAPHAPRLYLGKVQDIDAPEFFLGRDGSPFGGSCFIFALGHKYRHGQTIGVVAAHDPDPTRYAPDKATDFLSHFCDILACTLITLLEHAQLEELTVRDALTGANNRTYLERHAPRILDFAQRKGLPVHLLFIDLNGFKAVNDTLGHDCGDLILSAVARSIQGMIRKYDILVRLGGDEFVVVLPDTDENMAKTFVTRLRQTLARIDIGHVCALDTDLRVSAAVGMSRHLPGQTLEELIRDADQGMYTDKSKTCNSKSGPTHPSPVASGAQSTS